MLKTRQWVGENTKINCDSSSTWNSSSNSRASSGIPAPRKSTTASAVEIVTTLNRKTDEMRIPHEMDDNKVTNKQRMVRTNPDHGTPPIIIGMASIGTNASNPKTQLTDEERSLPRMMSQPLRSVRKRSPSVFSRFSAESVSAVRTAPASRQ